MASGPTLFTQDGCADSALVRDWLRAHHVAFVERNVSSDMEAAKALIATGMLATPLLVTDAGTLLGFHPDRLSRLLSVGAAP